MPFAPWTQQVQGARYGEPPPEEGLSDKFEEWKKQTYPDWLYNLLNVGTTTPQGQPVTTGVVPGIGALGTGAKAVGSALAQIPKWMGRHKFLTGVGALGTAIAVPNILNRGGEEAPAPTTPSDSAWQVDPAEWLPPPALPTPDTPPEDTEQARAKPEVIEIDGVQFWWNPTGGIYGDGGWERIPAASAATQLTPEQQMQQAELDRQAAMARAMAGQLTPEQQMAQDEAQRQAQMAQLRLQYELAQRNATQQNWEQQAQLRLQAELSRGEQAAQAAQQMAQMYAQEPYKYWAQMGQGTPGAVARLTGGKVAPGQQMRQVPLSTPSAQWWGNLLPSEQEQIAGAVNWLGVNPQDWYSTYQRMIPGLSSRQVEPSWAR